METGFKLARETLTHQTKGIAESFEKSSSHYDGPSLIIPSLFVHTIFALHHTLSDELPKALGVLGEISDGLQHVNDAVSAVEILAENNITIQVADAMSKAEWVYNDPKKVPELVPEPTPDCDHCVRFSSNASTYAEAFERMGNQFHGYSLFPIGRDAKLAEAIREGAFTVAPAGLLVSSVLLLDASCIRKAYEATVKALASFEGVLKGLV